MTVALKHLALTRALSVIDAYLATPHAYVSGLIPMVLALLEQPRRTLELLRTTHIGDSSDMFAMLWSPVGKPMRTLSEFPAFLKERGFIELWDRYGAPDDCKRIAAGNYDCTPATAPRP